MFQGVMRFLTGIVIELDKIAVLKAYMREMGQNMEKSADSIGKIRGQIFDLERKKVTANKDLRLAAECAREARSKNDKENVYIYAAQVARLTTLIETYDGLLTKLNGVAEILQKVHDNTKVIFEDTKNDIEAKEAEYNSITEAHNATTAINNVLNGDANHREIYQQAMSMLQSDASKKVGHMEQFMIESKGAMQTVDLQTSANARLGLELIDKMEEADKLLLIENNGKPSGSEAKKGIARELR